MATVKGKKDRLAFLPFTLFDFYIIRLRNPSFFFLQTGGSNFISFFLSLAVANDCGNLSVLQNGSLFGSETTFPNVITFSCDEGFLLKGSKVRKCQANKTWTGNTTYCDGKIRQAINGFSQD